MADFGSSATDIQAPQDAGSSPVVTQRSPMMPNTTGASFAQLGATLAVGVQNYMAEQQKQAQNAIVGDYARKQAAINSGVDQGSISPQEAHVRSNALANESLAAYPQLAEQFGKVHGNFVSMTSLGDTDKAYDQKIKEQAQVRATENAEAQAQGWHLPTDPNDPARDVIIKATTEAKRAEYQFEQLRKKTEFERTTNTYNQTQGDREEKRQSEQLVNQIFTSNWDGLHAQLSVLRKKADSGEIPWDQAQFQMTKLLGDTKGVLQSATIRNPELAGPYNSLIDNLSTMSKSYLDPNKKADELDATYKASITQGKISAIADPEVRAAAVASSLFGNNNSILSAFNAQGVVRTVTKLSNTTVTNGKASGYVPNIIGATEETDVYKALREGVDGIKAGKNSKPQQGWQEGSNTVNNILTQTGQLVDSGNAKILKPAADFFASSQFLELQKNGALDPASLQAAKKTFQVVYEPAVRQSISTQLSQKFPDQSGTGAGPQTWDQALDVKMVNGAPTFVAKAGLSPEATKVAQDQVKNLSQYQQGLNTVVRIGAHMEGTSDYQKYWEDNKYGLLPQLYPVKPGQVVNGFKWSGNGDWHDKSTWSKASG
jgi:hypothetical protein